MVTHLRQSALGGRHLHRYHHRHRRSHTCMPILVRLMVFLREITNLWLPNCQKKPQSQEWESYSESMIEACQKVGMKPLCDHPNYCTTDPYSLYLGQLGHLSYPEDRNRPSMGSRAANPPGFDAIKDKLKGLCMYAKAENQGKAVCNIPLNTHNWATPKQAMSVGNGLTFMCGRVKNNGASENKCQHGHSPKVCTLQCAEIMVPFYKQCESKINKNPEMKSLMDKCLDTEMNSVDALLRRIKGLREKGCTVDLTGIDSGSAINKQCHCRTGFEPCCHRRHLAQQQSPPPPHNLTVAESRRQLQGKSCQIGESRRVQQSCCSGKSSCRDGVPNMCSAECALEYGTFWDSCRSKFHGAVLGQLRKVAEMCSSLDSKKLLEAIAGAKCH